MGTRALAVLLLVPSLALAQTAGTLTATPPDVGRAECASTASPGSNPNVTLNWAINTANTGRSAVANSDRYRVAAYPSSTSCPAPTSAPAVSDRSVIVKDEIVTRNDNTGTAAVYSGDIGTAAANVTCPAPIGVSASDVPEKLCVYLVSGGSGGTAVGSNGAAAEGTFTFQLARPPAPVLDSVTPANGALIAYFHAGTATGTDNATSSTFQVRAYQGSTLVSTANSGGAGGGVRVGGLANNTLYTVRVVALSPRNNESAESNSIDGTPLPFVSFWENYQDAGGQEQGGCGGGAGALSLLALLPLALRRRRR